MRDAAASSPSTTRHPISTEGPTRRFQRTACGGSLSKAMRPRGCWEYPALNASRTACFDPGTPSARTRLACASHGKGPRESWIPPTDARVTTPGQRQDTFTTQGVGEDRERVGIELREGELLPRPPVQVCRAREVDRLGSVEGDLREMHELTAVPGVDVGVVVDDGDDLFAPVAVEIIYSKGPSDHGVRDRLEAERLREALRAGDEAEQRPDQRNRAAHGLGAQDGMRHSSTSNSVLSQGMLSRTRTRPEWASIVWRA